MRRVIVLPALLAVSFVSAFPVMADEPYAVTPSGRTEAIFDLPVVETSDKIANGCADIGWTLVSSTQTMVVCEAKLSTMQSVLAALAMGNAYSTPPKQFLRFNIAGLGPSSRVQATGWMETQMAFGQVRTQEMDSANYHNSVTDLFISLGGRLPPGTKFPYHAYLGFSGGKFLTAPGQGLQIDSVEAGSPAEQAGLQSGDVITKIARERIKGNGDILDAMRKAAKAATYEVEYVRGGKPAKMAVARAFREDVTGPDLADLPPPPEPVGVQPVMAALSAADELAKFADLRDKGIITQEEFDAKKAKLLAD